MPGHVVDYVSCCYYIVYYDSCLLLLSHSQKMSSADISVQSSPTDAVSVDVSSDNAFGKIVACTAGQGIKRVRSLDDRSDIIDQLAISGFTTVAGKKIRRLDKSKN